MKILVFNGSPKKEKSDTMHITRAFLDGMREAAAQEIRTIDVTDKHIEFCRGCFVCKYNGGHCAIDDDMLLLKQGGKYPLSCPFMDSKCAEQPQTEIDNSLSGALESEQMCFQLF